MRQAMYFDMKLRMPNFVLLTLDRISMSASIEARAPFLDHKLIEAGPWAVDGEKSILRESVKNLLPAAIVSRRKQGFVEPGDAWLRGTRPEAIENTLSKSKLMSCGLFNPPVVIQELAAHRIDTKSDGLDLTEVSGGYDLMAILSAQLWVKEFIPGGIAF